MKYLCLVYRSDDYPAGTDAEEQREYLDSLRRTGHFIAGEALAPVSAGMLVRVRGGRLSVVSPPAGPAEQLDGLFLVDARDLNEAILLAARSPSARAGTIEVRPVRDLP